MRQTTEPLFDWDAYGRAVLAGAIPVCKWTRLGVERHYRDLHEGHRRGLWFSEAHAQHALEFFLFLHHSKGEWAGQQFVPSAWQQFWIALAFGWMRADGTRRFRRVWEEVPRKNGKSTKLSGIGLYLFYADGEGGPEVYTAATKMDQAKITHDEAVRMVKSSPFLSRRISDRRGELFIRGRADTFKPLGRDSKTIDGLNPHGAILDEVHAHPDSGLLEVIRSGTGARRQWLIWMITTAGVNLRGPGFELHGYAEKVLDRVFEDDEFLAIVYSVDDPEQWTDETEWQKANPNLGVSVYLEGLRDACNSAKRLPSEQPEFKTKRLNIWLSGGAKWIALSDWRRGEDKALRLEDFYGQSCWIGLDLAERRDIAALCLVFRTAGRYIAFWRFFQNEYQASLPENRHYLKWSDMGYLHLTPGLVRYTNALTGKTEQVRAVNAAVAARDGGRTLETVEYPGIPTAALAARVAQRDLRIKTSGLKRYKATFDRRAHAVTPGQPIRLRSRVRGIEQVIVRVARIEDGTLTDGRITLTLIQDVFGLPQDSFIQPPNTGWTAPDRTPQPIAVRRLMDVPYRALAGRLDPANLALLDPSLSYLMAVAAAPNSAMLGYRLADRVAGGGAFTEQEDGDWCPTGLLSAALTPTEAPVTVVLSDPFRFEGFEIGMAVQLDDEVLRVDALNATAGSLTLARGCADSVPSAHAAGARLWGYEGFEAVDDTPYSAGVTLETKLLTQSSQGGLSEDLAPTDSLLLQGRQGRPYPPARLRLNGQAYPSVLSGPLTLSWAHRDRLSQADQLIDTALGHIGPEPGTTYSLRLLRADTHAVLISQTGLTGTEYTLTPTDSGALVVEVWSVRGGLESLQRARHSLTYSPS